MEAVENVQGLGAVFADEFQIGFPHVGADEGDFGDYVPAHGREEPPEGFDGSFLPDPKQARDAKVNLIDQGSGTCALWHTGFRRPDSIDLAEDPMLQPEGDDVFDGIENLFP